MTVHVRVDGWEVEKMKKKMPIKADFKKITCKVQYSPTFSEGEFQTIVTATLNLKTDIGTKLAHPGFQYMNYLPGKVDKVEACAKFEALKEETAPVALVERSLVRQDWKSPKNTDTVLAEKVSLVFDNKAIFESSAVLWTKGKYCSQKPD